MGAARAVYRATLGTRSALVITLALLGVLFAIASVSHFWLLVRAVYLLGLVLSVAAVWSFWQRRGLSATAGAESAHVEAGEVLRERIVIHNSSRLPKGWVEVTTPSTLEQRPRDHVVSVAARGETAFEIETPCPRRGAYRIDPLRLRTSDPFGLISFERRFGTSRQVLVYPTAAELPRYRMPTPNPGQSAVRYRPATGPAPVVGSIRPYSDGDSERLVHWPSSLRRGRLMVKQFDEERGDECWVVVDVRQRAAAPEPEESSAELAISAAAAVTKRLAALRHPVGLIVNGARLERIPVGLGVAHAQRINEALALAEAGQGRPLAQLLRSEARGWRRRTSVVVISAAGEDGWVDELLRRRRRLGGVATVLIAGAESAATEEAASLRDMLESAGVQSHVIRPGDELGAVLVSSRPRAEGRRG